jgi:hypothetical protein
MIIPALRNGLSITEHRTLCENGRAKAKPATAEKKKHNTPAIGDAMYQPATRADY